MADGSVVIDIDGDDSGFKSKLKSLGSTAVKSAAVMGTAIAGAAATAAGVIAKSAIENYAAYEQLTGGVETLFKDSASTVENYAKNAYTTAGMSANQYMETATSFSASLIQSLGGDTAAAAEEANKAITDMSDNVNKMGSNMDDVEHAYQGFAKQNYTMLDNLKLGYGGTKEEMARLLADAQAISGVEYNLDSYADVVDAIHVIQDSMGITGTTAKEASTTIEGSINTAKAAWTNLMTGLSDDSQDLGGLVQNFVDSVITVGNNLAPRIQELLPRIADGIQQLVSSLLPYIPAALETLLPTMIDGITAISQSLIQVIPGILTTAISMLPQLAEAALTIITNLGSALIEAAPSLMDAGLDLIHNLTDGIRENLPDMIPAAMEALMSFSGSLRENVGQIVDAGLELIKTLAQSLIDNIPVFIETIPTIITNLAGIINDNAPKLLTTGIELLAQLALGLIKAIPTLVANIPKILLAIVSVIMAFDWLNLGGKIISGIGNGLKAAGGGLKEAMANGFSGALKFIKELPGKALKWGKDMIGNFIDGIKAKAKELLDGVSGLASGIRSFLHFSVPDKGPLADADTYMPDMMDLLAKGIDKNAYKIKKSVSNVATDMKKAVNSNISGLNDRLSAAVNTEMLRVTARLSTSANPKPEPINGGNTYQITYAPVQKCDEPVSARKMDSMNRANARRLGGIIANA